MTSALSDNGGRHGDTAFRAVSTVARWLALIGGLCILAIVVLTVVEVFSRRLTGRSIGPVDEVSGYLFAAGVSLSLAWAMVSRAHIRIDILYARLPRRLRIALDLLSLVSLAGCALLLVVRGWFVLAISWNSASRSASTLGVPMVLPQGVWLFGLAAFAAALIVCLVLALRGLARRDAGFITTHLSPPNVDDIMAEEAGDFVQNRSHEP